MNDSLTNEEAKFSNFRNVAIVTLEYFSNPIKLFYNSQSIYEKSLLSNKNTNTLKIKNVTIA